jgi:hypothetical protein
MKLNPRRLRLVLLTSLLAAAGVAQAADEASIFSLSGFATLGLVKTDNDNAQYVLFGQPRGADKGGSAEVDTKLGVQVGAKFNPMFSATVQVLSKQNGKGNFNPAVEWAFVKAQVMPGLALRAGRMGGPYFAVSDFRDVGYANTWLRPPSDVYGQVSISHFDGADVSYQLATGLGNFTAQLFGGKSSDTVYRTDIEYKNSVGINTTLEMDNGVTLRFGHVTGKLTVKSATLNGLVTTLRTTPFAAVGDQLDPNNKKATFTGVGMAWDGGEWLVNTEYTQRRFALYAPDTDGWYVTVGRRVGTWTPYATASQVRTVDSNVNNTIQPLTAGLAQLKAVVDGVLAGQRLNQKTLSVGTRWDFYRNFALKAQLDHIKPSGNGIFTAVKAGSGFGTGTKVNVLSLSVDTVF